MTTLNTINIKELFEKAIRKTKLDNDRELLIQNIANKIAETLKNNNEVNVNFICTHNSRRSQFSQVWAYYAMEYFGILNGNSFSSGTAETAFHPNTIKALNDSGFKFSLKEFNHSNPKYIISYPESEKEILGFSKIVENTINKSPFIAITTCGHADQNCPVILEASARFHLPYVDPKVSDGTNNEKETYFNTSKLIAGEMGILFKKVKALL